MCGIFGVVSKNGIDYNKSKESLNKLAHRGPDQWNEYSDNNLFIGHRRLSILDLSEYGRQPMLDDNTDVIITVNGEIYNFKGLRNELKSKGYRFKSTSDSEVILYGYKEWGVDKLLDKIDGMFAFIVYDRREGKIYLCRDRVGIKPLYYGIVNDTLVWSSELKAIENYYGEQNLTYDNTALYDFFTYQYIPTPKTLYKDIYKLAPANYINFDIANFSFTQKTYWKVDLSVKPTTIKSATENIKKLLKESVNEQMVSDVPVGFFLSGGIDSSVVVGLASQLSDQIETFSIGFTDKQHDETHFADKVAKLFKTKHHKKILNQNNSKELLNRIKEWYDEPFADLSCIPTYLVSEFARSNVTVVLTGDGGDEIFGGYKWYKAFHLISKIPFRKTTFIKLLANLTAPLLVKINSKLWRVKLISLTDLELYTKLMGGMLTEEKKDLKKVFKIDDQYDDYWYYRKYYKENIDIMTRLQYLDFKTYLHDDILTKVDRVSMSVALECRVPFLSRKLIEYSFSLPTEVRNPKGELKGVLKKAMVNVLPNEILYREKKGFSIPTHKWRNELYGKHKNRLYKILNDSFNIKA